ncbi:MAG: hypothetical protein MUO77_17365, partial [Anaerolineales bacterium]|nr:hypothetical protein [Anaerolineales bacterium]
MNGNEAGLLQIFLLDEPVGMLLAIVTTLLLFGSFFSQSRRLLPWFQNIFYSTASAMLFLGLVI